MTAPRAATASRIATAGAQAQRDLVAARIAEVEAVVQCRIALVNLCLAEASLLQGRRITLDPVGPPDPETRSLLIGGHE